MKKNSFISQLSSRIALAALSLLSLLGFVSCGVSKRSATTTEKNGEKEKVAADSLKQDSLYIHQPVLMYGVPYTPFSQKKEAKQPDSVETHKYSAL